MLAGKFDSYVFKVDAEDQQDEAERLGDYLGAQSWTYKEQSRTTSTVREPGSLKTVTRMAAHHSGWEENAKLFENPPKEIRDLATQHGY